MSASRLCALLAALALVACGGDDSSGATEPTVDVVTDADTGDGTDATPPPDAGADSLVPQPDGAVADAAVVEPYAKLLSLETPRGATVDVAVFHPGELGAAVLLLEGGEGKVTIGGTVDAPQITSTGFLARNAEAFADHGLLVAIVDAPSDYQEEGLTTEFRQSAEHAQDIGAVADWLHDQTSEPVWVLGMSMGSLSATNAAIRLQTTLDGFGVASGLTTPSGMLGQAAPNGILGMDVASISVPAVVVGHEDDACEDTPASGVAGIAAALTGAPQVTTHLFTGGDPAVSPPCGPKSPHGYFGLDEEVVAFLAEAMLDE